MESARSIGDNVIAQINTLVGRLKDVESNQILPPRLELGPYVLARNDYGWYVYQNSSQSYYLRPDYTFQHGTDCGGKNSGYFKSHPAQYVRDMVMERWPSLVEGT